MVFAIIEVDSGKGWQSMHVDYLLDAILELNEAEMQLRYVNSLENVLPKKQKEAEKALAKRVGRCLSDTYIKVEKLYQKRKISFEEKENILIQLSQTALKVASTLEEHQITLNEAEQVFRLRGIDLPYKRKQFELWDIFKWPNKGVASGMKRQLIEIILDL